MKGTLIKQKFSEKGGDKMRKLMGIVVILTILVSLCLVPSVSAGTTDTITITATGSEVDISVDEAAWDVGYVYASGTYNTPGTPATSWATLTSGGVENVDVTIAGRSMKNAAGTHIWTLSDTAEAGDDIFGMKAGLDDEGDLMDIIILNVGQTLEKLVDELATGTQDFGLRFLAPTVLNDLEEMEMVGAGGTAADVPRGLVLTGSIDV